MEHLGEFVSNHWVLFSIWALILTVLAASFLMKAKEGALQIPPTEVTRLINHQDAIVIDVREKTAYAKGHILGAMNLPLAELPDRLTTLTLDRSKPVVLYCQAGTTSVGAVGPLTEAGFAKVYRLKGGLLEWQESNLPVAKGA
jgi:rhodanese-related sulfurtransferase